MGLFGAVVMVIFVAWRIVLGGANWYAVVVSVVILGGVSIDYLTFPFISKVVLFSPVESFIVTLVWMLVIINMFNLIDGLDGLASGVSAIAAVMLFYFVNGVAGVCIVFVIDGINIVFGLILPAAISLGNSGAFLLGYFLRFVRF